MARQPGQEQGCEARARKICTPRSSRGYSEGPREARTVSMVALRARTRGETSSDSLADVPRCASYDFFYKNGVPVWRGTGYYYSRFRPGLGVGGLRRTRAVRWGSHGTLQTVLVFLVFVTSGVQYLVQRLNYTRDLKRIDWIVSQARTAAWGSKLNPVEGQRKVCCGTTLATTGSHGTKRLSGEGEPGRPRADG